MGKKMLALGTSEGLRRKHGDRYHVHLIMTTAPHTPDEDMDSIKAWINANLLGATVEDKTFHGQLRFSVPASRALPESSPSLSSSKALENGADLIESANDPSANRSGIGALFTLLEAHKEELGFEYYSVSQTTLDQVFLSIVGKHNIEEENYHQAPKKKGCVLNTFGLSR